MSHVIDRETLLENIRAARDEKLRLSDIDMFALSKVHLHGRRLTQQKLIG